jgi:hypothetical protein
VAVPHRPLPIAERAALVIAVVLVAVVGFAASSGAVRPSARTDCEAAACTPPSAATVSDPAPATCWHACHETTGNVETASTIAVIAVVAVVAFAARSLWRRRSTTVRVRELARRLFRPPRRSLLPA